MGQRCTEHIHASKQTTPSDSFPTEMVRAAIRGIASGLRDDGLDWREVQARMSDDAGFMCSPLGVRKALAGARRLNGDIRSRGLRLDRANQAERCVQWRQMAFASEACAYRKSNPDIFVMQSAEDRAAKNTPCPLYGAR
jgi:succinate dehydrogenase / fumarate reductase flavoprotein subunit